MVIRTIYKTAHRKAVLNSLLKRREFSLSKEGITLLVDEKKFFVFGVNHPKYKGDFGKEVNLAEAKTFVDYLV